MVWHPDMDVRCGVRTAQLVYKGGTAGCTVRGERRADGERFWLFAVRLPRSRSWFGVCMDDRQNIAEETR